MRLSFVGRALGAVAALLWAGTPAWAGELLQNGSFESPVAPLNGNNFYLTIPNWTVAGTNALPANIVKPYAGYLNNPTATPTGGGSQYFDINGSAGTARQTFTVPSAGMIDFSAWFSVRDTQQAIPAVTINIYNSSNILIGSASVSFLASDPIGLWKQASAGNLPVVAGTYTAELAMPDPANADLASVYFKPALTVTKTSAPYSDPANGTTNPKLIPGALAEYTIAVTSPSDYVTTSNTVVVTDATPSGLDLSLADIGTAGSGPASLVQGSPSSNLTYSFSSLGSTTDNIDFSNDNGVTWTYSPTANANGVDPSVSAVRVRPQGAMAAGSNFSVHLRYRIR